MEKGHKKRKNSPVKNKRSTCKKSKLNISSKQELIEEHEKLKTQEKSLDKEIADLKSQGVDSNLKPQMEALHEYNAMKDFTQMVLGYIADIEQTTVSELHKQFNLPTD